MKLLHLLVLVAGFAHATSNVDEEAFAQEDIIYKDVAIVGGGAAGTYAAVRLREDYNKSIVLIEQEDHLGGHVNTYYDPGSNTSIDYGVLVWWPYGKSVEFFERFNLPTMPYVPISTGPSVFINSDDGSNLSSYAPPAPAEAAAAVAKWINVTSQYEHQLIPGFWDFWSPEEIPAELLLPFGQFAERHGIQAAAPIMTISNVGVGGIENVLTLYVYFAYGRPAAEALLNRNAFVPNGFNNSELYNRALGLLRKDVLLESRVVAAERNAEGVRLVVQAKNGHKKLLVKAKRLIFTPPPSLHRLAPFDLDAKETAPLSTWTGTWSFGAVARIPSIPSNSTITFTSPDAAPSRHVNIRDMPYALSLVSTNTPGDNLFEILFSTNYSISHHDAKALIASGVRNMTLSGTFADSTGPSVDFVAFNDHSSVLWRQSPEQLRAGIVQDIVGLQGYRSTWYAASLMFEDYQVTAWAFVDSLLPRMLAGM